MPRFSRACKKTTWNSLVLKQIRAQGVSPFSVVLWQLWAEGFHDTTIEDRDKVAPSNRTKRVRSTWYTVGPPRNGSVPVRLTTATVKETQDSWQRFTASELPTALKSPTTFEEKYSWTLRIHPLTSRSVRHVLAWCTCNTWRRSRVWHFDRQTPETPAGHDDADFTTRHTRCQQTQCARKTFKSE